MANAVPRVSLLRSSIGIIAGSTGLLSLLTFMSFGLALGAMTLPKPIPGAVQFNPTTAVWHIRGTSHFEIYYTRRQEVDSIAREAERAYASVSRELRRQVSAKVPLILLPTRRDLPRSEREAAVIVRASGAPDRDHLLFAVEPRADREKDLAHELRHIFEFDQRSRRP